MCLAYVPFLRSFHHLLKCIHFMNGFQKQREGLTASMQEPGPLPSLRCVHSQTAALAWHVFTFTSHGPRLAVSVMTPAMQKYRDIITAQPILIGRRYRWMVGSTKGGTLTWEAFLHFLFPTCISFRA